MLPVHLLKVLLLGTKMQLQHFIQVMVQHGCAHQMTQAWKAHCVCNVLCIEAGHLPEGDGCDAIHQLLVHVAQLTEAPDYIAQSLQSTLYAERHHYQG